MSAPHRPPLALIPPPLLFAAVWLLGYVLHRSIVGVPLQGMPTAGVLATSAGIVLALSAGRLFAHHRTTFVPHGSSSALVIAGPYRFTRNPMYVSLVLMYLGVTVWTGAWTAVALLPVPWLVLNQVVIPMEERQLQERFGSSYEQYRGRVRRWL